MGQKKEIVIRDADLGPVIARTDHLDGAIEVNREIFYRVPPMVQEYVLCHEVCHLQYGEHDEARTNALAAKLFLDRASTASDLEKRKEFVSFMSAQDYSNFAWTTLISSLIGLGTTIFGVVRNRNAGWYSWDSASQRSNVETMLVSAFEQSRRSGSESAAYFFWQQMSAYTNKDDSLEEFLNRSDNAWVYAEISRYEQKYGFGFREVTPIDLTAYPLAMLAIGLLVGAAAYLIIKKARK